MNQLLMDVGITLLLFGLTVWGYVIVKVMFKWMEKKEKENDLK